MVERWHGQNVLFGLLEVFKAGNPPPILIRAICALFFLAPYNEQLSSESLPRFVDLYDDAVPARRVCDYFAHCLQCFSEEYSVDGYSICLPPFEHLNSAAGHAVKIYATHRLAGLDDVSAVECVRRSQRSLVAKLSIALPV